MIKRKQNRNSGTNDEPVQPDPNEQSGSTGRHTGVEVLDQNKDTGQGKYGQSGYGGVASPETIGQSEYRKSGADAGQESKTESNQGSGRADHEAEEYRGNERAGRLRGEHAPVKK